MAHATCSVIKILLLLLVFIEHLCAICIPPHHCIEDMEESTVKERYDYVLAKYNDLKMKIAGEPIGLRGKLVTHGNIEEQHIVFQYKDNTPHDIIQNCVFVVSNAPGECESIVTQCNTFLARTPRPLLERKPLAICDGEVREIEVEEEGSTVEETDTTASALKPDAASIGPDAEFI